MYNSRQHRQCENNNRVYDPCNVSIKNNMTKSVYNQPPAKGSSTSHVFHDLVCLTYSLLTSVTCFSRSSHFVKRKMDQQDGGKGSHLGSQRLDFHSLGD